MINPTGTHALNPFRARANRQVGTPNVSMGTKPGEYDANNARGMAIKSPVLIAGWGYDVFGRPIPSQAEKLQTLNNDNSKDNSAYYGFANTSGSAIDPRGTPAPYGAEVPAEKYVGGALDVRYNQRHGIWQTDHGFLAKITAITKQQPTKKNFYNIYEWEEVEITKDAIGGTAQTPVDRALQYPAKGKAINLNELTTNINDAVYSEVPVGTIVELKAYLAPVSDGDFTLKPIYAFNQATNQNVFLRIDWNIELGYPAPLSASDPNYTDGTFRMCNRFLYRAEVVYFAATGVSESFTSPWGIFNSYTPPIFVQAINLIEWGNPIGQRGMVSPGVITIEAGGSVTPFTPNLNYVGSAGFNGKSAYPSGFAIRPISHDTLVEGKRLNGLLDSSVTSYGPVYYFNIPNAHDGGCERGPWPFNNTTQDVGAGELTIVKRTNQ
jgi:hypothetical protein